MNRTIWMACVLMILVSGCSAGKTVRVNSKGVDLDGTMRKDKVVLLGDIEASRAKVAEGSATTAEASKKIATQSAVGFVAGASAFGIASATGIPLPTRIGIAGGILMAMDVVRFAGAASASRQPDKLQAKLAFPYVVEYSRVRNGAKVELFEAKAKAVMSDKEIEAFLQSATDCGWQLLSATASYGGSGLYYAVTEGGAEKLVRIGDTNSYYERPDGTASKTVMYRGVPGRSNFWKSSDFSYVDSDLSVQLFYREGGVCGGMKEAKEYFSKYVAVMAR